MYRKLMWCYVFVLTLLDLSLNSKLTAQGKSHGVTVHDSLVEGITFQEWGSDSEGGGGGSGRALPASALRAEPPALALGRAPLGAAHAATVTLTNTANTTMHLASIAGTTPDFHASFFDSKTLACGANTSFSVVFLGRREGLVAQHLYIHTSLGVLKYPVSAIGVGSEWALWPLVGVLVPHNATLRPLLSMHNPTDSTVQVVEMYSSASWLGLQLPDGGARAPRQHWQIPPRTSRALARLRLRAAQPGTRAAYIRIKANVTGPPLVVVVEATAAPAGAHADPLQLRAGTRGQNDDPYTFSISMGNSEEQASPLHGGVFGGCARAPHQPAPPSAPANDADTDEHRANGAAHTSNGAGAEGVSLSLLRAQLEPHQALAPAATVTMDFAKLWASGSGSAGEAAGGGGEGEGEAAAGGEGEGEGERYCAGWAALPAGALPYSVRLLPGTLRMPPDIHFVTADKESCLAPRDVRVRNEFSQPVRIVSVEFPPDLQQHFETESLAPLSLAPGADGAVARLKLRRRDEAAILDSRVTVLTDLTHTRYGVCVKLYQGTLHIEWQWPGATSTELPLGTLATSMTRRVLARVRNPAPAPLCVTAHAQLPGATFELSAEGGCVPAGGWAQAVLTVVAPARAGAVAGSVWLAAAAAAAAARVSTAVTLSALPGAVRARLVHDHAAAADWEDYAAAPYASGWAPALVVDSSMTLRMKLTNVEPQPPDPALVFIPPSDPEAWWIGPGTSTLGRVAYRPELACGAACYTGVAVPDAGRWLAARLADDLALLARRRALYDAELVRAVRNVSLALDTTEMVRIPVSGWVRLGWPRLVAARGSGWAGLAGVGAGGARWLRVRNPASTPLLLEPRVHEPGAMSEVSECLEGSCSYVPGVFACSEWRLLAGGASAVGGERGSPALLLEPGAEVELKIDFTPPAARLYHAALLLRNNLTVLEAVPLGGRGAVPSFELGQRVPHHHPPILLQVSDCEEGQDCTTEAPSPESESWGARWTARRAVAARNTGAVPLRLRGWRLAGEPCAARGFSVQPCAPITLQPNESRTLTLVYRADCSLARTPVSLTLRADSGPAEFKLLGVVPAKLLPACAASLPRPPWEPALRGIGGLAAVAALAIVLAAAALDAERLLRRAQAARAAPPSRAPLDLRALARDGARAPVVAPVPAPKVRKRPARRVRAPLDPEAERRAFERWRAEVLRREAPPPDDDEERSSSEATSAPAPEPTPPDEDSADTEEPADEDAASTGSGSSSPDAPDSPLDGRASPATPEPPPRAAPADSPRPAPAPRPPRAAGSPASPARRAEPAARPRPAPGKHHARKDKVSKRRGERTGATLARVSPPHTEPRASTGAGGGGGANNGASSPHAAPALRWGASWSSVVATGTLAPIGADIRRAPAPASALPSPAPPLPDNSLFFYNDAASLRPSAPPPAPAPVSAPAPAPLKPEPEYTWRANDRSPFDSAPRDYRVPEDSHGMTSGNNAYGTIGSPWGGSGGGAAWAGAGSGANMRPPPGFGPPPPPPAVPAPPPVRPFDPFHSLASIWAPAAFDWRAPPRPPAPRSPRPR